MGKRVILEKTVDPNYPARYDLRVQDSDDPEAKNVLALTYAKELDGFQLLVMRTPHQIKWRTISHDEPFGIARDISEANERLYRKLESESLAIARQYKFEEVHDLTDMANQKPLFV